MVTVTSRAFWQTRVKTWVVAVRHKACFQLSEKVLKKLNKQWVIWWVFTELIWKILRRLQGIWPQHWAGHTLSRHQVKGRFVPKVAHLLHTGFGLDINPDIETASILSPIRISTDSQPHDCFLPLTLSPPAVTLAQCFSGYSLKCYWANPVIRPQVREYASPLRHLVTCECAFSWARVSHWAALTARWRQKLITGLSAHTQTHSWEIRHHCFNISSLREKKTLQDQCAAGSCWELTSHH